MDKPTAANILDETFLSEFDIDKFGNFIKELFNDFRLNQQDIKKFLPKEYNDFVDSFHSLGTYMDDSKNFIQVFAVGLKRTSSRDRARTMQRNLIAKFLEKNDRDAALVAFYGDEPEDWRFSFVKMEYELVKEDGKVKPKTKLTPAKRSSYLVGLNEPNHTCRTQFLDLIREEDIKPTLEQIEAAFSIETVTKEFFTEYKKLFLDLKESLEDVIADDEIIMGEFKRNNILTTDFAKKLLGQIVFIYFLQKKGWLGVEKQKSWGEGPKNFLRKLFEGEMGSYENFFNDMLEPLFYEALATERDDDYYSKFNCKIPFLNGGLFEPANDYDWVGTDITLDNKIFKEILDTFDLFNFTIKEDEPLEKEVAVDPEMLGKVFENLLEIIDRKSKGAFYTPREIVHYMCQQSLINYLETNLTDISLEDIEYFIQKGDFALDKLIKEQEQKKKYHGKSVQYKSIPESIRANSEEINRLLADIKVVDPAVGSGAFPVGMMNEIVRARSILSILSEIDTKNYDLKRETIENCLYGVDIDSSAVDITKLRFWLSLVVDEEDIHDIKPLPNLDHKIMCGNSLVEEFEGMKLFDENLLDTPKINPELERINAEKEYLEQELELLMNKSSKNVDKITEIDNQISILRKKRKNIISQSNNRNQSSLFASESQKKLKLLKEKHELFFNAESPNKKKKLRKEIESIEWEFIEETLKGAGNEKAIDKLEEYKKNKSKPFFLWKLYFAEIFQIDNPGFDVVIANPPYIEFKRLESEIKNIYKNNFYSAKGKYDIYVLFIEFSRQLLSKSGVMTFINPTMFLKRDYGKSIREFISNNYQILKIIDFSDIQVFEGATNYTGIFIFKNIKNNKYNFKFKEFKRVDKKINISDFVNSIYLDSSDDFSSFNVLSDEDINDSSWNFKDPIIKKLLHKISDGNPELSKISEAIFQGIASGKDEVFYVNENVLNDFSLENELIFPILKGKDVKRYKLDWGGKYVIYPYDSNSKPYDEKLLIEKFPRIYNYFLESKNKLSGRGYFEKSTKYWYELWNQRKMDKFMQMRIVVPEISKNNNFMLTTEFFGNTKTYHILLKDKSIENYKYVLAILNSSLIEFYYHQITVPKAGGFFAYKTQFLKNIPIKTSKDMYPIVNLVDEILEIKNDEKYTEDKEKLVKVSILEKEIDKLVFEIYNLTNEDIDIINNIIR